MNKEQARADYIDLIGSEPSEEELMDFIRVQKIADESKKADQEVEALQQRIAELEAHQSKASPTLLPTQANLIQAFKFLSQSGVSLALLALVLAFWAPGIAPKILWLVVMLGIYAYAILTKRDSFKWEEQVQESATAAVPLPGFEEENLAEKPSKFLVIFGFGFAFLALLSIYGLPFGSVSIPFTGTQSATLSELLAYAGKMMHGLDESWKVTTARALLLLTPILFMVMLIVNHWMGYLIALVFILIDTSFLYFQGKTLMAVMEAQFTQNSLANFITQSGMVDFEKGSGSWLLVIAMLGMFFVGSCLMVKMYRVAHASKSVDEATVIAPNHEI